MKKKNHYLRANNIVLMPDVNPVIEKSSSGILSGVYRYTYVLNNPLKYTDPSGYWKTTPRWKQWWYLLIGKYAYINSRDGNSGWYINDSDDGGGSSGGGGGGGYSWISTPFNSPDSRSYSSTEYSRDVYSHRSGGGGGSGNRSGNVSPGDPPKETSRTNQSSPLPPGPWSNETFDQAYDWTIDYSNPGINLDPINPSVESQSSANGGDIENLTNWYTNSDAGIIGLGTSLFSGVVGNSAELSLNSLSKSDAAYNTLRGIRTGSGILSNVTSGISFGVYTSIAIYDPTWGNIAQAGMNGLAFGLTFGGPYTAWAGFGISVADSFGTFDSFYDNLNFNQDLYNTIGTIMIPSIVPGIPGYHFIRIKR